METIRKEDREESILQKKVVEHNDLVMSSAKMDIIPLKIFELAVAQINTEAPPKDNIVHLSKAELFKFLNVSDNNKHTRFKQAIVKMQKQAFFEIREEENKGFVFRNIVPIPYVEWNDYNDQVTIRFDSAIMPYLTDLNSNFTQFILGDIQELNSKYAIIIYKWLNMHFNQYLYYRRHKNRDNKTLEELQNPVISIDELRWLTSTQNMYTGRFGNFENNVLKNPIKEINKNTKLNVSYDKLKKGRKIDQLKFHISLKETAIESAVKPDDSLVEEVTLEDAQNSPYSQLLMGSLLINFSDIQNENLMLDLAKKVYPEYDSFVKEYSMEMLRTHLDYIQKHKEKINDLTKYLLKSLKDYKKRLKAQRANNGTVQKKVFEKEKLPEWAKEEQDPAANKENSEAKVRDDIDQGLAELDNIFDD